MSKGMPMVCGMWYVVMLCCMIRGSVRGYYKKAAATTSPVIGMVKKDGEMGKIQKEKEGRKSPHTLTSVYIDHIWNLAKKLEGVVRFWAHSYVLGYGRSNRAAGQGNCRKPERTYFRPI